ncbi:MAG TPA: hypothetical protein VGM86_28620 [Thermoanaerobaculia bacterium]
MSRRLGSFAAPALLILLTASAAQARPLHVQAPPAGLLTQVWQALSSSWVGTWAKDGVGLDPNGNNTYRSLLPSSIGKDRPSRAPVRR